MRKCLTIFLVLFISHALALEKLASADLSIGMPGSWVATDLSYEAKPIPKEKNAQRRAHKQGAD